MTILRWFSPGHPAQLIIGLIIWSLWFVAMYAGLSVVCQLAPSPALQRGVSWLNIGLAAFSVLVILLLVVLAWRNGYYCAAQHQRKGSSGAPRFIGYVSTVLYLAAAVATAAGGLPVLVLAPCA